MRRKRVVNDTTNDLKKGAIWKMIKKITENDINNAFNTYGREYGGRREDYFALLYLANEFDMKIDDASSYVSFDPNKDYGIDAFYFDQERRNLYLYQFKWSDKHLLFKESLERLARSGVDQLFATKEQDRNKAQIIIKLKTVLSENKDVINRIFVRFVFDGDPDKAEQSKVLDSLRENLEAKSIHKINTFFEREIGYTFQFVSNQKTVSNPIQKRKSYSYILDSASHLPFSGGKNELIITFVPLAKFLEMFSDLGDRLFSQNIRSGLGEGKATNKQIMKSFQKIISDQEPIENFTFYHNGISLTAEDIKIFEDKTKVKLTEPRILNGAQTIRILSRFVEKNRSDKRLDEKLQLVRVMVRIIKSDDPDFLIKVTINNNRQNPIMPWNLRANDGIQLEFEDKFKEELNLYYERRESAFDLLRESDLKEMGINPGEKPLEITKLSQTLLALQGETEKMSRMSEVFENDNLYHQTFKKEYLNVSAKRLFLLYKIHLRLNGVKKEIIERGEYKYYYVTKATNLLWALLIQGLLNDQKFEEYVEKHGNSFIVEGEFTKVLKDIASKKIRFIFSRTFSDKKYAQSLEEEKYSFLKSKATFDDCMESARKEFGWYKKEI